MSEMTTTGIWRPRPGQDAQFVAAWTEFASWAATMPGASTLRLGRDVVEVGRYVSYGTWTDGASVHDWKSTPEFRERMAKVLQHVDDFRPAELDVVATS